MTNTSPVSTMFESNVTAPAIVGNTNRYCALAATIPTVVESVNAGIYAKTLECIRWGWERNEKRAIGDTITRMLVSNNHSKMTMIK